jgi:hypothetical protein
MTASMTSDPIRIGVFDSGFGGLTVLRALLPQIPAAEFFYLGDTARLPYGSKSQATVARYAVESAQLLESYGADYLVIACNTASALALDAIRSAAYVPVLGVYRKSLPAAGSADRGRLDRFARHAGGSADLFGTSAGGSNGGWNDAGYRAAGLYALPVAARLAARSFTQRCRHSRFGGKHGATCAPAIGNDEIFPCDRTSVKDRGIRRLPFFRYRFGRQVSHPRQPISGSTH